MTETHITFTYYNFLHKMAIYYFFSSCMVCSYRVGWESLFAHLSRLKPMTKKPIDKMTALHDRNKDTVAFWSLHTELHVGRLYALKQYQVITLTGLFTIFLCLSSDLRNSAFVTYSLAVI